MKPALDRSHCRGLRWTLGFLFLLLAGGWLAVRADDDPFSEKNRQVPATDQLIKFDVTYSPKEVKPGDVVHVTVTGKLAPGYHTYPLTQKTDQQDDNQLTQLKYLDTSVFQPLFPVKENRAKVVDEQDAGILAEHDAEVVWEQDFFVRETDAKTGKAIETGNKFINLSVRLQVCSGTCVYGMHFLETRTIIDGKPKGIIFVAGPMPPLSSDLKARLEAAPPPAEILPTVGFPPAPAGGDKGLLPKTNAPRTDNDTSKSSVAVTPAPPPNPTADTDLLSFMGLAVLWGALSLGTPCVFPMIPITVSFFIKQSEAKKHSPLLLALIYSGTIAAVLTVAGVFLIQILQPFSQHYLTNFALGALFIIFALSLFGMYEIVLPSRLVNLTSSQEGRGGIVGTVFMALTFSIISFTCVAPFYGGFIGIASSSQGGSWWSNPSVMLKLGLGALAYSVTFASPFFFLALFPSLMRALPKSGSWMNTVKVVMGFLELAAALKLLRASELSLMGKADYLTYDVVLGLYVALAFACSAYLLNLYRLPHDYEAPESLSVMRLLCSITFLALGIYMVPGLFKQGDGERQRPAGVAYNWIEGFLLADEEPATGPGQPTSSSKKEVWSANLVPALNQAEKEQKLVFIDFTGQTCANCRMNEKSVFPRPEIRALFDEYVLVKLYCDTVPPWLPSTTTGSENQQFRDETFKTAQLPLYVIVKPTGNGKFETVDVYPEGKINFPARFAEFLRKPLKKAEK